MFRLAFSTALIVSLTATLALAEDVKPPSNEWYLNSKPPTAGEHRPDYYFQTVIQIGLHTPTLFTDDAIPTVPLLNFRSPGKRASFLVRQGNGWMVFNPEWAQDGGGVDFPTSMTTEDVEAKIKEMIPAPDPVVQDSTAFGGGYCLGRILYVGKIGVVQHIPKYEADWQQSVKNAIQYTPDSGLCFGPVSKSPQILQFKTPDIRALTETLLVISGLYPIDCKKKEGTETEHVCEFTAKGGSVVSEP